MSQCNYLFFINIHVSFAPSSRLNFCYNELCFPKSYIMALLDLDLRLESRILLNMTTLMISYIKIKVVLYPWLKVSATWIQVFIFTFTSFVMNRQTLETRFLCLLCKPEQKSRSVRVCECVCTPYKFAHARVMCKRVCVWDRVYANVWINQLLYVFWSLCYTKWNHSISISQATRWPAPRVLQNMCIYMFMHMWQCFIHIYHVSAFR